MSARLPHGQPPGGHVPLTYKGSLVWLLLVCVGVFVLISSEMEGGSALFLAHDLHAGSLTLVQMHLHGEHPYAVFCWFERV